jgi:hypothetical protein
MGGRLRCARSQGKRPDPDTVWCQSGDGTGEKQFGELAGQGSEQQRRERGGWQGVDVADQDHRWPGLSGCEQELHEVVIAGD